MYIIIKTLALLPEEEPDEEPVKEIVIPLSLLDSIEPFPRRTRRKRKTPPPDIDLR